MTRKLIRVIKSNSINLWRIFQCRKASMENIFNSELHWLRTRIVPLDSHDQTSNLLVLGHSVNFVQPNKVVFQSYGIHNSSSMSFTFFTRDNILWKKNWTHSVVLLFIFISNIILESFFFLNSFSWCAGTKKITAAGSPEKARIEPWTSRYWVSSANQLTTTTNPFPTND